MRPDWPGPEVFGSMFLTPTKSPTCERDDDEGEPAERGGLPVCRAPATHAGCQVAVTVGLAAEHDGSPFSPRAHGISTSPTLVTVVRSAT